MRTALLFAALVALAGCLPVVDSQLGVVPCIERCATGCCEGDPSDVFAYCVRYDDQDDAACGHDGHSCHACEEYDNPFTGERIATTCSRGTQGPYGNRGCVKR